MRDEPVRAVPKPIPEDKAARRRAKARGKYHEQQVARRLGGRLTISSGRTSLEKGDVRVPDVGLFLEVKYLGERVGRKPGSVTFPREWAEKTILDAEAAGLLPVVALRFGDGVGLYATTADVFEELIGQIRYYKHAYEEMLEMQADTATRALPQE